MFTFFIGTCENDFHMTHLMLCVFPMRAGRHLLTEDEVMIRQVKQEKCLVEGEASEFLFQLVLVKQFAEYDS